jgi:pimeloyl-ACP methyl ester carboxylesterase
MFQTKSVKFLDFKLSYQVFGEGNQTVICLHGHGRSSDDFHFLAQNNLRVISIDLFFHGESLAPKSRITRNPISWSEIQPVFEKLFIEEKIAQFHVLAFSQGGRFALLLLEYLPERIQSFTLLAPDGLNNKSFYNWSSRRRFFRSLFIRWQKKPEKLQKLANTAVKLKMMRPKVRDFVHHFSSDPETMKRAANTWMAFRKLQPNPTKTGEIIRSFPIEFNIIMGKYDQVIRPIQAKIFLKNAGLPEEIIEIENGHDFFKSSSIEKFVDYLPFLKTEK